MPSPQIPLVLTATLLAGCGPDRVFNPNPPPEDRPTVRWDEPLSHADPALDGVSLAEIISSLVSVADDGRGCADCHHAEANLPYRPPIAAGQGVSLGPYDVLDGRTWAGPGGWAERLALAADKPTSLQEVLGWWVEDETVRVDELTWWGPLSEETLGTDPDPALPYGSILDIVSSDVSAQLDDQVCSDCHHEGAAIPYRPPVARGGEVEILPTDPVDGRTWSGPEGWADRFIALGPDAATEKPAYLRAMFYKWRADGAR